MVLQDKNKQMTRIIDGALSDKTITGKGKKKDQVNTSR